MATKKGTTRSKGTGSIYQRSSDGMWCTSVELPSEPGKRRRKVIVRAKRADVVVELRKVHKDLTATGDMPTSSPTLAQWCDLWWTRYGMTRLKVSTRSTYQTKIGEYIKPAIGKVRLDKLTVEHVYRLHAYIIETKQLSPGNALGTHRVLSSLLTDAVREGRVARNVASIAEKPRVAKRKKEYLDNAEAAQLLAHLRDRPAEAAQWGVALLTGKRIGEVLGLTRSAIDLTLDSVAISWQVKRLPFQHGCGDRDDRTEAWPCARKRGGNCPSRHLDIPVDQEVQHLEGGLYLTRPKSSASHQVLPMVGYLRTLLERHLETSKPGLSDLVFTRTGGRPIDPADANRAWHALLAEAGLPDVDVHSTRHTCNTILTELGIPVDVRQAMLGHASAAVNEAVYTHTSDVRVADAMRQLGETFTG